MSNSFVSFADKEKARRKGIAAQHAALAAAYAAQVGGVSARDVNRMATRLHYVEADLAVEPTVALVQERDQLRAELAACDAMGAVNPESAWELYPTAIWAPRRLSGDTEELEASLIESRREIGELRWQIGFAMRSAAKVCREARAAWAAYKAAGYRGTKPTRVDFKATWAAANERKDALKAELKALHSWIRDVERELDIREREAPMLERAELNPTADGAFVPDAQVDPDWHLPAEPPAQLQDKDLEELEAMLPPKLAAWRRGRELAAIAAHLAGKAAKSKPVPTPAKARELAKAKAAKAKAAKAKAAKAAKLAACEAKAAAPVVATPGQPDALAKALAALK